MIKEKQEKTKEKEKKTDVSKKKTEPKTKEKSEPKKPTAKDIEKKVIELAEKGLTAEKIGLELKKDFGKIKKKKISKILKEKDIFKDPDFNNVNNRVESLKKHLDSNRMDFTAKKALEKNIAKIRKLKKFQEK